MTNDFIRIRGARQNHLKGVDLDLPLGELIVVAGVSGVPTATNQQTDGSIGVCRSIGDPVKGQVEIFLRLLDQINVVA